MPAGAITYDEVLYTGLDRHDSALIEKTELAKPITPQPPTGADGKSKVQFASKVRLVRIEHINEMIHEQVSEIWYSSAEFMEIRTKNDRCLELLTTGKAVEDEDHTMRGLECRTQAGYERRRRNKRNALYAVLDEQERQRKSGTLDPEVIAGVYLLESEHCTEDALEQGIVDEEEVFDEC
eukprot:CAMPEP_0116843118 /NCGR_PEP_ID=MMETSP0418-20121206/11906_1 /TAXON_ID=1158023 /ORGANISM="Astrosyne radiata, Strain 13vi08-1A" /LENGTH=179 /DNA_ID=CAMNT_0004473827 /DNA_START=60 /DNA_END=599 /DNA_ORIENTATION=-